MEPIVCVLVTGVGGRSVGHQILTALKVAKTQYRIVATDASDFSFGLYIADARYVVPSASDPGYLPAIIEIVRREKVQVVLPGTQAELQLLAAHTRELDEEGCRLIASAPEVVDLCLNKGKLYEWLSANGYGVPRSAGPAAWKELAAAAGFPLVGKPTEDSGGSKGVALLADEEEVEQFLHDSARSRTDVVFQEYVGSAESEYTVGVIIDKNGRVVDSIVMHRNLVGLSLGVKRVIDGRVYALSTGYSQGFIETHPAIAEACETVAVAIGIRGPANIQLRLDGEAVKIFEIHPRFSGTTSIRAECGFNEPDVLIKNYLFGESQGRIAYQRDVAAIRAFQTVIVPRSDMQAVERMGGAQ
ncbi:MAG: carbamoyl-phosphate synthase large subunit [Thermoanaerobaculia bacterium]|jgi:carbamoyl-phosphate synthase large subunit|nr:carbamoyl-phosphate synthase large subunit [Thermoanaerobaculia bacterium]